MKLFIPTYKRTDRQTCWDNLPEEVKEITYLLVRPEEEREHVSRGRQVIVLPEGNSGVGPARQWLLENSGEEKLFMIDDDIVFKRRKKGEYKLRSLEEGEYALLFKEIEGHLDEYDAVGVSQVAGNNHSFPKSFLSPGRMFGFQSYRSSALLDNGIRFDSLPVMEDFHVILSLLELGHPNLVLQDWAITSRGSNAPGGCSTFRNLEVQKEGAEILHSLHPEFVTLVEKESKSWGGGMEKRTDVRVQWKKALESGKSKGEGLS